MVCKDRQGTQKFDGKFLRYGIKLRLIEQFLKSGLGEKRKDFLGTWNRMSKENCETGCYINK